MQIRKSPSGIIRAATLRRCDPSSRWSEHLGFRKVLDASFMIAFMFLAGVDTGDVEKYMNGLRGAQMGFGRDDDGCR